MAEDTGLRRHLSGSTYGYAWLLVLIAGEIAFQMAAPADDWARVVAVVLQGITLIAALSVAGVHRRLIHLACVVALVALVSILGLTIGDAQYKLHGGGILGLLLAS